MNKSDLIDEIAERAQVSKKDASACLSATIEAIGDAMAADKKVQLIGFGTFETRARKAREGKNPATGAKIKIPACKVPAFKAGKALKDKVN